MRTAKTQSRNRLNLRGTWKTLAAIIVKLQHRRKKCVIERRRMDDRRALDAFTPDFDVRYVVQVALASETVGWFAEVDEDGPEVCGTVL